MKSFWESRTLFSKRVLAAGGKSGGGFGLSFPFFLFISVFNLKKVKFAGLREV
jgi:hypothetical protein